MADTLAGGQLILAGTPLVFAEQSGGAAVSAALAKQIARLNGAGKMSFKEALGLRVSGIDQVFPLASAGAGFVRRSRRRRAHYRQRKWRTAQETGLRWMVRGSLCGWTFVRCR